MTYPVAPRNQESEGIDCPPGARRSQYLDFIALCLIWNRRLPEIQENKCMLFDATQCEVICYHSHRNEYAGYQRNLKCYILQVQHFPRAEEGTLAI